MLRTSFVCIFCTFLSVLVLVHLPNPAAAQDLVCSACVDSSDIAPQAVTTSKIAAGAVSGTRIATGAVSTAKIANGAISTAKLAANAVRASKISDGAIIRSKVALNAIDTNRLAANAVRTSDIAAGAVTFTRLSASLQNQLDDLDEALAAITNPPACSNQSLAGNWQTYIGFADPESDTAAWARCQLNLSNTGTVLSATGCVDDLNDPIVILGGRLTTSGSCVVSGQIQIADSPQLIVSHATLDRLRNTFHGVGRNADVGPVLISAVKK